MAAARIPGTNQVKVEEGETFVDFEGEKLDIGPQIVRVHEFRSVNAVRVHGAIPGKEKEDETSWEVPVAGGKIEDFVELLNKSKEKR